MQYLASRLERDVLKLIPHRERSSENCKMTMSDDGNKYRIRLSVRGDETIDADVYIREEIESASECTLTVASSRGTYTATAGDYFDAFCAIRLELEVQSILPLCYGASRNVYPSGMCRDMGRGLTGYKMVKGERARQRDLVHLFTTGPDVDPATVQEQRAFVEQWRNSFSSNEKTSAQPKHKPWWRLW